MLIAILVLCCSMFVLGCFVFVRVASERQANDIKKTVETNEQNLLVALEIIESIRNDVQSVVGPKSIDSRMSNIQKNIETSIKKIARSCNENTYKVLKDLISAVETNDTDLLSDVVRSAKHLCQNYENMKE